MTEADADVPAHDINIPAFSGEHRSLNSHL